MRLHVKTFILQENMFPTPKNIKKTEKATNFKTMSK